MIFNRKKEVVKKHVVEKEPEVYIIPQIPDDTVGLRELRHQFEKTVAVSPMEGPYTKDVITVPNTKVEGDVDLLYDPFRVEPKLTVEDEIRRFGVAHHEFPSVDSQIDPSNYQKKPESEKVENSGIGLNFGIIQEMEDIITPEAKVIPEVSSNPNILFGQPDEHNPIDIGFNPINIRETSKKLLTREDLSKSIFQTYKVNPRNLFKQCMEEVTNRLKYQFGFELKEIKNPNNNSKTTYILLDQDQSNQQLKVRQVFSKIWQEIFKL